MRHPSRASRLAFVAGVALLATACGGGSETGNDAGANMVDGNIMFEEPGNDASALETVNNAVEPLAPVDASEAPDAGNAVDPPAEDPVGPLGETSGGDTGGNTVGNVSGM